jgi:hypothetical protein
VAILILGRTVGYFSIFGKVLPKAYETRRLHCVLLTGLSLSGGKQTIQNLAIQS